MDKKAKKRLEVLRQKLEKTQKLITAARLQPDEPQELADLQHQLQTIQDEIEQLRNR